MTLYDVINSITIKTSDIIGQVFLVLVKLVHTIGQDKFTMYHAWYIFVCMWTLYYTKERIETIFDKLIYKY